MHDNYRATACTTLNLRILRLAFNFDTSLCTASAASVWWVSKVSWNYHAVHLLWCLRVFPLCQFFLIRHVLLIHLILFYSHQIFYEKPPYFSIVSRYFLLHASMVPKELPSTWRRLVLLRPSPRPPSNAWPSWRPTPRHRTSNRRRHTHRRSHRSPRGEIRSEGPGTGPERRFLGRGWEFGTEKTYLKENRTWTRRCTHKQKKCHKLHHHPSTSFKTYDPTHPNRSWHCLSQHYV